MRALIIILLTAYTYATPRAVVTFVSPTMNTIDQTPLPSNVSEVKRYGRRLVVNMHRGMQENDTEWLTAALGGDGVVQTVEPDMLVGVEQETTDDQETTEPDDMADEASTRPPWNLDENEPHALHIRALRERTNTTVAVLDSGIAAVAVAAWLPAGGYDFISSPEYSNDQTGRDPDFTDPGDQSQECPVASWHGTRVASIVEQIAPSSRLLILRVLGRCGSGFANDVTDAIVWSAGGMINGLAQNPDPAHVISMSFAGKGQCPSYLQSAVNQAIKLGAVLIAAAGNAALNAEDFFPGNCYGVLPIGATTRQGTLAPYSNYGPTLAVSAPGGDASNPIFTLSVSQDKLVPYYSTGTSFAAPHISALFLLLSEQQARYTIYAQLDECNADSYKSSPSMLNCKIAAILANPSQVPSSISPIVPPNITTYNTTTATVTAQDCFWAPNGENQYYWCDDPGSYIVCINGVFPHCSWCAAGSYSSGRQDACTPCPIGKFAPGTAYSVCTDCPANSFYPTAGATACNCPAGTYQNGAVCAECPAGSYSTAGMATCNTCNPGTFTSQTKQSLCSTCSAGTYSRRGETACTGCSPGTYTSDGASCHTCGAGTYAPNYGQSGCTDCPATYYCPAPYSAAVSCTKGNVCPAKSADQSICPAQKCCTADLLSAPNMDPCTAGSFCPAGCSTPTSCTPGRQCASGSSSGQTCSVGTFCSGGNVVGTACPQGAYCPAGSSAAVLCPRGTASQTLNAQAAATCIPCSPGTYADAMGKITCDGCPKGTYMSRSGAEICTGCLTGTYTSTLSNTVCTSCERGRYQSVAGQSVCTQCAIGKYSDTLAAVQISTCLPCQAGSYASTTGMPACTLCSKGSFGILAGQSTSAVCNQCSPGSATGSDGMTQCKACDAGYVATGTSASACLPCQDGYYSAAGASQCTQCKTKICLPGQTKQECSLLHTADESCTDCPIIPRCTYMGTHCTVNDIPNGVPACNCEAGFELSNRVCVPCGPGAFSTIGTACRQWTASPCPIKNFFRVPGTPFSDSACQQCPDIPPPLVRDDTGTCTWTCDKGYEKIL